jgi:hypothetical protein
MKRKHTDTYFDKKSQKDLSSKSVGFRIPFIEKFTSAYTMFPIFLYEIQ